MTSPNDIIFKRERCRHSIDQCQSYLQNDKYFIPTRSEPHRNKLASLRRRACTPGVGVLVALHQVQARSGARFSESIGPA
ncbi:hypothetical protein CY34DRAFT_805003 [Suillus luteus UH-Slu-Lm8-n1]|uniref:Uncharacterized protein n=1 Tax=Suillus luteus UH-Slu-Lm8-n1 TaxID=930992 RepID=A0A0C9ZX30_9AGAM|nr:hypothetical protein CY34DRAFT_805003 [Suillus luteus UH-Slu-Lm8-n1]